MKGQASLEYLIITGFVFAAIILPGLLFIYSVVGDTASETLSGKKISSFGSGITSTAKELYYLGIYSKLTVDFDFPNTLTKVFVAKIPNAEGHIYYLVVHSMEKEGLKKYYFLSEVPLIFYGTDVTMTNEYPEAGLGDSCDDEVCTYYRLDKINAGVKKFKLETYMDGSEIVVRINPVF